MTTCGGHGNAAEIELRLPRGSPPPRRGLSGGFGRAALLFSRIRWHGLCGYHDLKAVVMKSVQPTSSAVESYSAGLHNAPEFIVFSACLVTIESLRSLADKFADGKIDQPTFVAQTASLLFRLRRTAEATQRFDVVMPVMDSDKFSPFFWGWFNWWFDYSTQLTLTQFEKLEKLAQQRRKGLAKHRPKGDWLHYRQTPALVVQMVSGNARV